MASPQPILKTCNTVRQRGVHRELKTAWKPRGCILILRWQKYLTSAKKFGKKFKTLERNLIGGKVEA